MIAPMSCQKGEPVRSYRFRLFLLWILCLGLSGRLRPAESAENQAAWPGFRGDKGLGVSESKTAPESWNLETGENVQWKTVIPLPGASSPVIWGNRVFLTGAAGKDGVVYCVHAGTGQIEWQGHVPLFGKPESMDEATTFAPATPATDGKLVYAVFVTGAVAAFDMNGTMVWFNDLGLPEMYYGYASSPILHENLLIIQYDQDTGEGNQSALVALDTATGDEVWRAARNMGPSWSSPALVPVDKGFQLVVMSNKGVSGYAPTDGKLLWFVKYDANDVAPSPGYAGGLLIATLAETTTLAIRPDGSGDVTETHVAWDNWKITAEVASPVGTKEYIFHTPFAEVICLSPEDGKKLGSHELDGTFYASPILAAEKLYVANRQGRMTVHKADPSLNILHTCEFGERLDTTPAIVDGRMYVRTEKHLYCIGGNSKD